MLAVRIEPELEGDAAAALGPLVDRLEVLAADPAGFLFTGAGLLAELVVLAERAGAASIEVEVFPAGPEMDVAASGAGLTLVRTLLQLRRHLPAGGPGDIVTRPFRPGTDDEERWLAVNNRAFDWHPEQGGWTLDDLHARMAEPWFDADGFLLHEVDGRLAGFCWTKVHRDERPVLGEIFVIGVDPDFHGQGLGAPLTLAGLDWLGRHDATIGMLYVESDNQPALRVYNQLGFSVFTTRRWYERRR